MASEGERAVGPLLGETDLDEFRRAGHRIVDWIADYRAHPECYPVLSRCRPGEVRAQLPRAAPSEAESIECILNDFERLILPGITHWNHPAFFAYFAITGSGPGILGELLASALNVNAMLWRTSPAATELEECCSTGCAKCWGCRPTSKASLPTAHRRRACLRLQPRGMP